MSTSMLIVAKLHQKYESIYLFRVSGATADWNFGLSDSDSYARLSNIKGLKMDAYVGFDRLSFDDTVNGCAIGIN